MGITFGISFNRFKTSSWALSGHSVIDVVKKTKFCDPRVVRHLKALPTLAFDGRQALPAVALNSADDFRQGETGFPPQQAG
jgi:hypothetical protein